MVDRAFSEWDKASMSKYLQTANVPANKANRQGLAVVRTAALKANENFFWLSLALLLALIIPSLSGVL